MRSYMNPERLQVPSRLDISCEVYDYLLQNTPSNEGDLSGFTQILNYMIQEKSDERTGTGD